MEELKIIWILTIGMGLACFLGYIAQALKLSPILGYLLAGYFLGPNSPGFVADKTISNELASIGVTLLMFAVGLNFNWKDLYSVKKIVVPGAILLSGLSAILGMILAISLGEEFETSLVLGLAVCVSSTVIVVRNITDLNLMQSPQGKVVMGWTLVEDLISVVGLFLLPALVFPASLANNHIAEATCAISLVVVKTAIFGLLIYTIGGKLIEKILILVARTRSHELFTLAILAIVFFIASGSAYLFNVSLALGAFVAGTVVGKTNLGHQAAANAIPMRDAFSVLFFLSVGMLFNPAIIGSNLFLFFGILLIILVLRPVLAYWMVKLAQYPKPLALTIAFSIGQIGEYSFILAEEGHYLNLLSSSVYDLIVACAIASIVINPLLFKSLYAAMLGKHYETHKKTDPDGELGGMYESRPSKESFLPKAVVIGYGFVGKRIVDLLYANQFNVVVVERNIDTVSVLKRQGINAIFGDASQFQILEKADIANALWLVVTTPDFTVAQSIIQTAIQTNPHVKMVARTRFKSDTESNLAKDVPIICDEDAVATKMIEEILSRLESKGNSPAT